MDCRGAGVNMRMRVRRISVGAVGCRKCLVNVGSLAEPTVRPVMNRFIRNRRGVTSVIAMLFLVLIGTLALGFYTSVTTATALAKNDRRTAKALMAAESGIQFMRNRLANVTIPPTTTSANLLNELGNDLEADAMITGNLIGAAITRNGNVITIPFICTDVLENSGFTVTLTDIGGVGEVVCAVKGRSRQRREREHQGCPPRLQPSRNPQHHLRLRHRRQGQAGHAEGRDHRHPRRVERLDRQDHERQRPAPPPSP